MEKTTMSVQELSAQMGISLDRLFRESALYRPKWDRDDYRANTINFAIESCNGIFHRSAMDHPPFVRFDDNGQAHVIVPRIKRHSRKYHSNYADSFRE